MFQAYKSFISNTLNIMFHHSAGLSISDYIRVVFGLFVILASVLIVIAVAIGLIYIPRLVYARLLRRINAQVAELTDKKYESSIEKDMEFIDKELTSLNKQKTKITQVFSLGLVLVYLPILVPLLLVILDYISVIFKLNYLPLIFLCGIFMMLAVVHFYVSFMKPNTQN